MILDFKISRTVFYIII